MFGDFHNKVQIKDVCLVVSGKSIPTKLEDNDGNNPYIKVADFNIPGNEKYITIAQRYVSDDSASYSKQIPEGSVIFAKNGAASMSNKKRLTKIRCCIDMNTMAVFPKNESILSDFLFATIEAMDVSSHVRQGAIPSISPKSIEDSYIAMPTMEEQYRYVSIAKHADKSGFDGLKSQFIEMFGSVESTKPLADFIEVSFPGEWGQEDKDGSGVKVIRTTNFTNNGKLDLSDVVTRDIDSAKVEKKKLFKGDIILERSGGTNDNPVGRVVYFEEDGLYLFNNFTQLLRCKEGVNSLFIFYSLFNYYQMNKNVIRSMGNKTTGIQNLKMDRYWQIPIADVSIERQKEFETIYRQADKSGFELRKSIDAIEIVIQSLIN